MSPSDNEDVRAVSVEGASGRGFAERAAVAEDGRRRVQALRGQAHTAMPKRTTAPYALQAAGAAAVPTASAQPQPKHPDAAAEYEYSRLVSEFTKDLKQAGIESTQLQHVLKSMDDIWVESFSLNQESVAEDTGKCLGLLATMLGQPDDPNEMQKWRHLKDVKHVWHPCRIYLACKTLVSEDKPQSWKEFARSYLQAVAGAKAPVNLLQAVLRDGGCMDALLEMLQVLPGPDWQYAAILLKPLLLNARPSNSLIQSVSDHISAVLELHVKEANIQEQKQQQASGQDSSDVAMLGAFSGIHLKAIIEFLAWMRPAVQDLAGWPDKLLHAHLCALIKVLAGDPRIKEVLESLGLFQVAACAHDLLLYAHPSILPKAALILSRDPQACQLLSQIIARISTAPSFLCNGGGKGAEGQEALNAHTALFQFLCALLSDDEASRALPLPLERLCASMGVIITKMSESVFDDMNVLQSPGFSQLLQVAAKLQLCLYGKAESRPQPPPSSYLLDALELLAGEPCFSAAVLVNVCLKSPEMVEEYRPLNVNICNKAESRAQGTVAYLECENGMLLMLNRQRPCSIGGSSPQGGGGGVGDGGRAQDGNKGRQGPSSSSGSSKGATSSNSKSTTRGISSSKGDGRGKAARHSCEASGSGGGAAESTAPIKTCMACGQSGRGLKCCSGCKGAFYCNASCQRAAWPSHRPFCVPRNAPNGP